MTSKDNSVSRNTRPSICIYLNKDGNDYTIGLMQDENLRSMTKVDETHTRFVDEFNQSVNDETKLVRNRNKGKRWIAAAKKNESIFLGGGVKY